ncbi:putative membrane protein YphA (DoxX/SURF4 family) [Pedobacter cryoconitis]|uniref:Putative membrane protein YphA (DoxX/SURF4 family) n=1 Tax=Pedobacter cryoconitis TaxID=188932 RepID=A0A7W8ZQA9_9SPHI|nr:DoxX family protein [Pedobacter cryoconitis]MBB5638221.1 putative membrane protein YphA (DoxX/SURF4 family) [Pedobacter cryoconitis]MBB6271164.1 putative membrane protein YphA (DoxX/SURF4 family) [Pedobacter cryoconitis]
MKNEFSVPQLFLRLALGIGFIFPVLDRMGTLGPAGANNISWGNWENFIAYTNTLLPFLSRPVAGIMGFIATLAEIVFAILLITGYKTRQAAQGSFLLTLTFGLCMALFSGIKAPFNYSVFADSAASLLLAAVPIYKWSLDNYFSRDIL